MQEYRYLLDIALILLMTKAFGLFSRRLRMPSVVGALIAGIVLGPAVLNIVEPSKLIESLSEIGVIVLMFAAGLETSITDLKKAGLKAFIIDENQYYVMKKNEEDILFWEKLNHES